MSTTQAENVNKKQAEKSGESDIMLKLLYQKRESLFQRINRLYDASKKITNYDSSTRTNENFISESEMIDNWRDKFESIVDDINMLNLQSKPDATPEYASLDSFEELYLRVKRTRNNILSSNADSNASSHRASDSSKSVVKLQPLVIPSFDGRPENWNIFYQSFKANIHLNSQLTDSQRVQYLISKLTHDALKFTAGIIPSGETYNILWDALVKKYQDNRALGTFYLNNILDIRNCSHSANALDSFISKFSASMSAFKGLDIPDLFDFIMLQCALRKMDSQTVQAFELSVRDIKLPTTQQLIAFVQDQAKILERSNPRSSPYVSKQSLVKPRDNLSKSFVGTNNDSSSYSRTDNNNISCCLCSKNDHKHLYECPQFRNMRDAKTRYNFIKSKHGCVNCLSTRHTLPDCKSTSVCFCLKKHHKLLHFSNDHAIKSHTAVSSAPPPPVMHTSKQVACEPASGVIDSPTQSQSYTSCYKGDILLSTAQVYAYCKNSTNRRSVVRCLIDNGSQNNLITTQCCRSLNLPITPLSNSFVKGVGSLCNPILGYVYVDIESRVYPDKKYTIHAFVVKCITDRLPTRFIDCQDIDIGKIELADLSWNIPSDVDVVLGAQLFPYIYLGNRVDCGPRAPPALLTTFGYVFMGDYPRGVCSPTAAVEHREVAPTAAAEAFSALALNDAVQKFWELEEVPTTRLFSPQEIECENIFTSTVSRDDSGRFSVALPFCRDPSELGSSYAAAYRRFISLERKLRSNPLVRENYNKVIKDYIDNGYLNPVDDADLSSVGYYIPHHAVVRPDKPLPRIVLDASCKTDTGLSLNDILHCGPNLQADLFLLLLNFRMFPIAMNADIKQHYLQIGLPAHQRKYVCILFRFHESEEIRTFAFNRQPFGLRSSPYIALRTVRQLASDMKSDYPDAANVVETCLYMDDLVHSAPNEDFAIKLAHDLIKLFKAGDFDLIKWSSNSFALLNSLPDTHRKSIEFDSGNNMSKVLGLSWDPCEDIFFYTTAAIHEKCTKRNILSVVARLFDVLGLVAPVILGAKLLIKELWLTKCDWDDLAPLHICARFQALMQEIHLLNSLRIPRHVGVELGCELRLVAFCDASLNGFGSVIYAHCTYPSGIVESRLLCAKSKVSPVRITTLARLELCAILLMSKLIKTVRDAYASRIAIVDIFAFSDSTIALSWVHSSPHRWSVFVSNRIAQCQENLDAKHFYHVSGSINPSDCLSRGMLPSQLLSHELWWNGPSWIRSHPEEWPIRPFSPSNCFDLPEHKAKVMTVTTHIELPLLCILAQRISSWQKLLRVIAYVLKFAKPKPKIDALTVAGLAVAEKALILAVQSVHFSEDIKLLKAGKLPSKKLQGLSVFLDSDGIVRIGGRLSRSMLPYEAKHPILLPKRDHIVDLIIQHYHVTNCHTGPGLLMSIIRQRYWILDARTVIRSRCRKCNICFKCNPSHPSPIMADLPVCRVSEAKAFTHTGVDYAGPVRITLSRRRGQHAQKAYIVLFICMVTRAVYIDLVSSLTTDHFLDAFKRFISRRGPVSCLYSDNATTFIGAKAQLDELYEFLLKSNFQNALSNELLSRRIEFKMIPPRSPNFGGIWESNIKSMKTHLYRVIGIQLLTYEELQTVLAQIECILNSRPMSVISSDPHPEVLTPAHFLMSTPLQYLPASDLSDQRFNLLDRKKLLDHMVQSFWKRWHLEYLHTLQVRQKWATPDKPIEVGTVVLLEQENSAPLHWPLGIITHVYKGSDSVVRVATVKTQGGSYKRAVTKLYPIPTQ